MLWHENENVPHRSSEVCSAGLDGQSIFPENDDKIVSEPFRRDHSKNAVCSLYG
jgi:hypothetical protein